MGDTSARASDTTGWRPIRRDEGDGDGEARTDGVRRVENGCRSAISAALGLHRRSFTLKHAGSVLFATLNPNSS
eukprot:6207773-Pleurochrysis_carterae.AAC.2